VDKNKFIKGALGPKDKQRINIPDKALQDTKFKKARAAKDKQKKTSKEPEALAKPDAKTVDTPAELETK